MAADWIVLYGSLMQGLGAMDDLALGASLEFNGSAVISGDLFDLGSYPGLRPGKGRVAGELYAILDRDVLVQLDRFEGVLSGRPSESLYRRERIRLIEPMGAEAWVYFYNRSPAPERKVVAGDWRIHLSERCDP
jgi:gamma-glutamylcyclotransferase (GGCT)/AIG2-like uncharacterized protein YtfP